MKRLLEVPSLSVAVVAAMVAGAVWLSGCNKASEPVQKSVAEQDMATVDQPQAEPNQGVVDEPETEPAKRPTEPPQEPETEPESQTGTDPAAEPAKEPMQEPATEPAQQPEIEAAKEPAKEPAKAAEPSGDGLLADAKEAFGVLPEKMPGSENDTKELVELGRKLYFEEKISINGTQSCNTCHRLDENLGGVDGLATSKGAGGEFGGRNAPTTLNAGLHIAQFWDGRAADLAEQAKGPVLNPIEMGMPNETEVMNRLKEAGYEEAFKAAFPDVEAPMSYDNYAVAVAAFERTLITRDRFDDYLKGDQSALSDVEKNGLALFMENGCSDCHAGALLGGDRYEKMGMANEYANKEDLGRFDVTKKDEDKYVFKVPSLRNIALTGPYFHDGKAETLADAVQQMAKLQYDQDLNEEQVKQIVAFLGSLSDKARTAAE